MATTNFIQFTFSTLVGIR